MAKFEKGHPGRPKGIESIKDSFRKVLSVPMAMDETGRASLDYVKLAKKRMTVNDILHLKLVQQCMSNGDPETYKQYLDTVKTYYPPQRIKEVIIEKLPTAPPPKGLSSDQLSAMMGGVDFDPKRYSDEELKQILSTVEDYEYGKDIAESEENIRGSGTGEENSG